MFLCYYVIMTIRHLISRSAALGFGRWQDWNADL